MRDHPRPQDQYLYVERTDVDGACPECGAEELQQYPVLGEGGWWMVTKCQNCLYSVERERQGLFGSISLISDQL
jgi:hypothetical protein